MSLNILQQKLKFVAFLSGSKTQCSISNGATADCYNEGTKDAKCDLFCVLANLIKLGARCATRSQNVLNFK